MYAYALLYKRKENTIDKLWNNFTKESLIIRNLYQAACELVG